MRIVIVNQKGMEVLSTPIRQDDLIMINGLACWRLTAWIQGLRVIREFEFTKGHYRAQVFNNDGWLCAATPVSK